ncbi:hypothetical protein CDAR_181151 [Caerostris darwini]|uniref:Uncharacterized protein n=1 Tax=Caerostris darwini TaxID=1538125 RepID=A0AAV4U3S9_9ARAC|nr:hypothetical protein CDAR_181151 [Caerostris darwini]
MRSSCDANGRKTISQLGHHVNASHEISDPLSLSYYGGIYFIFQPISPYHPANPCLSFRSAARLARSQHSFFLPDLCSRIREKVKKSG